MNSAVVKGQPFVPLFAETDVVDLDLVGIRRRIDFFHDTFAEEIAL